MLSRYIITTMHRRCTHSGFHSRLFSTYGSGGLGGGSNQSWMEAYPWANLTVGFLVGYAGTVFMERAVLKPKQAAVRG